MEPSEPLAGIDLNLLLVFDALMAERNVTRAAARLKRSQPAMSNALTRLRATLGDPLFVRARAGVVPTARALELAGPLGESLARLRDVLRAPAAFEATTARHTFVIAASDHAQLLVVPALAARLAEWPQVTVRVVALPGEFPMRDLERGQLDLVLGVFGVAPGDDAPAGLKRQVLVDERMAVVARKGNRALKRPLAELARLPQLNVSPRGGTVSRLERGRGLARNVVLFVPHYLATPWVLESTDLLAVMPERVARRFVEKFELTAVPLEGVPRMKVQQLWHPAAHARPAHQWLRARVLEAATQNKAPSPPWGRG